VTPSLLDRLARFDVGGAAADVPADPDPPAPDLARVVQALRRAAAAMPGDEAAALAAFDDAGSLHDAEVLDAALREFARSRFLPPVFSGTRRRLAAAARVALRRTARPGTLRLAAACLGELGGAEDAAALEVVGRHPAFVLHGATALANLAAREGRASLLRLLHAHEGDARLVVIDRLLPHAAEPAVRLALVRDALVGLQDPLAREVAPDIARLCDVRAALDDERTPPDVRAGARRVLSLL
jgi:hypothetical protein